MTLPNQLTALRILLAPVFYVLFAVIDPPVYGWAVLVFAVAAITDWYDGYFARRLGKLSSFGAFFDPLADKVLTSFAFIAFASKGMVPTWCVILIITRDAYLTIFRMIGDSLRQPIITSNFAKYKTFFQMTFICYVLVALMLQKGYLGAGIATVGDTLLNESLLWWLAMIVTALTVISAISYTASNYSVLKIATYRYLLKRSPQNLS